MWWWLFLVAAAWKIEAFSLDPSNRVFAAVDLYTVNPRFQSELVDKVSALAADWVDTDDCQTAAILASLDGARVFAYSQWATRKDDRAATLDEFFPPESHQLEITASRCREDKVVNVDVGDTLTHLAEFRMKPESQPKMLELTADALGTAMDTSPGLLSATFHRSLDGTRMFNYGQWESKDAFDALEQQPGFSKADPYWKGLANNEFFLYNVKHVIE
mmetsp:Transcript_25692/g.83302  ORF Transcript_25692/g.83302 Transcript_25692/m.83302 type:complete len:217 (+) Transcript_25692:179-829(+)